MHDGTQLDRKPGVVDSAFTAASARTTSHSVTAYVGILEWPVTDGPWWVVPPDGPDSLCTAALLASLLARVDVMQDQEDRHA